MAPMDPRPSTASRPRRHGAGLVASAALIALLAACAGGGSSESPAAPADAGEPVTIEFWGWVPNLEEAVEAWNAENPDIQVEFHRMTGDDGDKIPSAIDAGTAPDVFQLGTAGMVEQIIAGRLLDISDYVEDVSDKYDETAWASVTFGESIYGLPQDAGPSGMMYRTDIFAEHGIEVPTTWEEYLDAGRALKEEGIYLAQLSPNEAGFWLQQVWQAGGSLAGIDGDQWTVETNNEASMEVAALWQTALDEGLFKVVEMWTPEYWAAVNNGEIATINYLAWFPALLKENVGETSGLWAVTHSPRIGGEETAGSGGYGANVIPANTEHPAQAAEFAKWLNTSDEGLSFLIERGGIFPAALPGLENEALLVEDEFFGGQVINEVFLEEATKAPSTWVYGPTHNLTQEALKDAFARVANGELTFAEALDQVAADQRQDILDAGLAVK